MGELFQPPAFCSVRPEKDVVCEFNFQKEYAETHYPTVPYWRLLTDSEELDSVHSEIDFRKRKYAEAPDTINAFVTQAPIEGQPSTLHGIDWTRDIVLNAPISHLVAKNLATIRNDIYLSELRVRMGDKFGYGYDENHELREYEVTNVRLGDRIMNTEIPAYILLDAKVLRKDSADEIPWDQDPEE
jgi:hypothetical protein